MARNKIDDLRDHLFETLEALKDQENPMDLERARAISEVAQTIVNSAKVEVEMVRTLNGSFPGSKFFDLPDDGVRVEKQLVEARSHKVTSMAPELALARKAQA